MKSTVVNQRAGLIENAGIGNVFVNTSGFVNNAVVGQAVNDRGSKRWFKSRRGQKSVAPDNAMSSGRGESAKSLRRWSIRKRSSQTDDLVHSIGNGIKTDHSCLRIPLRH